MKYLRKSRKTYKRLDLEGIQSIGTTYVEWRILDAEVLDSTKRGEKINR
jgi:hypothetical protein